MSEKSIIFAGLRIPIVCDAPVQNFVDGGPSFYNLTTHSKYAQMMAIRPSGRVYSNRPGLRLGINELSQAPPDERIRLGEFVNQVVIHHDVTYTSEQCFDVLVGRGLSTHFMINHDGTLIQGLDIYHASWATGPNNAKCIAIDLNNPVKLERAKSDPANPPRQVFQGKVNGPMKVALGYTDAQYATLIALFRALINPIRFGEADFIPCRKMAASFFPPMDSEGQVITKIIRNHTEFVGFMGHWHCEVHKWDPGPGFDWNRVLAGVHGKRNSFPVLLDNGLNLAELQGQNLTAQLEAYYTNIEANETGGWYPIGANQSWHSGVHLHVDPEQPVLNMSEGTIVAVRNAKRVDLGCPGFVVVRHEMDQNVTVVDGEEPEPLYWWSVYMHLERLESEEQLAQVPWIQTLLRGDLQPPDGGVVDFSALNDSGFAPEKGRPKAADGTKPAEFDASRFWDGDIILTEIPVSSGEVVGLVGVFGTSEWNLEPQVHIEVLSAKNLFEDAPLTKSGSGWALVEGDLDDNSLVNIADVVRPIASRQISFDKEDDNRVLKTSEIQSFFVDTSATAQRSRFRRMICLHKSEWSPQTDWTRTAASAVGWQWETQEAFSRWLLTWIPFQWMTQEVGSHCEFPEDHRFYTYHPIFFLDYLNQSYAPTSDATAEAATDAEVSQAQAEYNALVSELEGYQARIASGDELTPEEDARFYELLALTADREGFDDNSIGDDESMFIYDGAFDEWEPGEWEPPKKPDSEFDF